MKAEVAKLTPLMKQYWDVKSAHPDKIILFRLGDFYEMFHDDAVTAAPILGIALTSRNSKSKDATPLCGVPHHSAETPINKLLKAGFKVAVCEQLEDPALAKGIVKRGVTRVLTPGMLYDPDQIPKDRGNYICAIDEKQVAFVDASTGEGFYYSQGLLESWGLIEILRPVEFLVTPSFAEHNSSFENQLKNIGVVSLKDSLGDVCERLRAYIRESQGGVEPSEFTHRERQQKLCVNALALKHLEIFETYAGERQGSFFAAIDRTKTSVGARQLRRWLCFPETLAAPIEARLDRVESWMSKSLELETLRSKLSLVGDSERRLGRLFLSNTNARDLLALSQSIKLSLEIAGAAGFQPEAKEKLLRLADSTLQSLRDELPVGVREGGMIRLGAKPELDELIELTTDHSKLLQDIELREKTSSGISSLKVKYNAVFGYFIEITNTHKEKAPKHYIRKQTLASAERFTTDELLQIEEKVLSAKSRRYDLEYEIYNQFKEAFKNLASEILKLSHWIGEFDATLGFAWLALENNYVRPKLDLSAQPKLSLLGSRHPVAEQLVEKAQRRFIPNDISMNSGESLLLTGPNMAGKSTLMRQVALAALLTQVGCFVPAREAQLPIFNRILTRIGSSDNLSEGLSTFMVEMQETAALIEVADSKSLVILDEIGRGTATFDGMSLAQAILEHLHSVSKSTLLFATHYHELAALEADIRGIQNFHMSVQEQNGEVKFLYRLTRGAAGKSYGIQVGTLAGLPSRVTQRAGEILNGFESRARATANQLNLFEQISVTEEEHPLKKELRDLDVNSLTPISALLKISEWRQKLDSNSSN